MVTLLLRVFLLAFLVSCGNSESILLGEDELTQYIKSFKAEAEYRGREFQWPDLEIQFGSTRTDDKPNRVGFCRFSHPIRLIVIDRQFYEKSSMDVREALVFHELGHCVLNRPHDDGCDVSVNNTCVLPSSLMNSILISDFYKENRDYYLQELFSVVYSKYSEENHKNCEH